MAKREIDEEDKTRKLILDVHFSVIRLGLRQIPREYRKPVLAIIIPAAYQLGCGLMGRAVAPYIRKELQRIAAKERKDAQRKVTASEKRNQAKELYRLLTVEARRVSKDAYEMIAQQMGVKPDTVRKWLRTG